MKLAIFVLGFLVGCSGSSKSSMTDGAETVDGGAIRQASPPTTPTPQTDTRLPQPNPPTPQTDARLPQTNPQTPQTDAQTPQPNPQPPQTDAARPPQDTSLTPQIDTRAPQDTAPAPQDAFIPPILIPRDTAPPSTTQKSVKEILPGVFKIHDETGSACLNFLQNSQRNSVWYEDFQGTRYFTVFYACPGPSVHTTLKTLHPDCARKSLYSISSGYLSFTNGMPYVVFTIDRYGGRCSGGYESSRCNGEGICYP